KIRLTFSRPVKGDRTFRQVQQEAIQETRNEARGYSYHRYNRKYVERVAKAWSRGEIRWLISPRDQAFATLCNRKYVKRVAKAWSRGEINQRYLQGANPTMKQFFPIPTWIPAHIVTDFIQTQFFSGHGGFRSYLKDFHIIEDDTCICDHATQQT